MKIYLRSYTLNLTTISGRVLKAEVITSVYYIVIQITVTALVTSMAIVAQEYAKLILLLIKPCD